MPRNVKVTLRSINGLTPEQYQAMQKAAEDKMRKKNRREHILYVLFVGVIALLASTAFQYSLVATITICGWVWLWFLQNIPIGPDGGMPRARGLPPIFGLLLFLVIAIAIVATGVFTYTLLTPI